MTGYVTGPDNQLLNDGTWAYTYDNEGNVVQKVGDTGTSEAGYSWVYGFDNANRLTSATEYYSGSVVVQELNFYAVNGNRVEQDVTQSGTTTITKFAYDLSGNVIADLNSSNGVVTRRMFLDATDSVFARIGSGGALDFYLSDDLGSIRGLENTSGTLDDAITFDAWGNKTSESNPSNGDRYGFTGREWDAAIDLQYSRARYYDPTTGRWMTQDAMGFAAGDSNLYRYTTNNPIRSVDPSGHQEAPSRTEQIRKMLGYDDLVPPAPLTIAPSTIVIRNGIIGGVVFRVSVANVYQGKVLVRTIEEALDPNPANAQQAMGKTVLTNVFQGVSLATITPFQAPGPISLLQPLGPLFTQGPQPPPNAVLRPVPTNMYVQVNAGNSKGLYQWLNNSQQLAQSIGALNTAQSIAGAASSFSTMCGKLGFPTN